jgi:hypothetical protein
MMKSLNEIINNNERTVEQIFKEYISGLLLDSSRTLNPMSNACTAYPMKHEFLDSGKYEYLNSGIKTSYFQFTAENFKVQYILSEIESNRKMILNIFYKDKDPGEITTSILIENTGYDGALYQYMPFEKFMGMLENEAIYFSRLDVFNEYFREGDTSSSGKLIEKILYSYIFPGDSKLGEKDRNKNKLKHFLVACFFASKYESYLMWETYGKGKHSIAIKASGEAIERLLNVEKILPCFSKEKQVSRYELIKYYTNQDLPSSEIEDRLFWKPKEFEAEHEYRILINGHNIKPRVKGYRKSNGFNKNGIYIPVKLKNTKLISHNGIIDKILVHPAAEDWFFKLVQNIVVRYGFEKDIVEKSEINPSKKSI